MQNDVKKTAVYQWLLAIVIAILAAFCFRQFLIRTVEVKGNSMEPNFYHKEVVAVNQLIYRFSQPKRGDIVVCSYESGSEENFLIKRVIGLPGETIAFVQEGDAFAVEIDGKLLMEPYVMDSIQQTGDRDYPFEIPEGQYFVMGDNRNLSADSRDSSIGTIGKKAILGQVFLRVWPLSKFGLL